MKSVEQLMAAAKECSQAGHLAQAEALYRAVLEKNPQHGEALHMLGVLTYQCGQPERAVELISRAIASANDNADYCLNLGIVQHSIGRLQEAETCCRQALILRPDYAEAHYNLGVVLDGQGQVEAAAASYRRALELRPAFAEAHYNLGVLLDKQDRWDEAIASFRRALEIRPDVAEAHNNLGAVLKKQGRLDEAIASFERALQRRPDYAEAHNNLGVALDEQGHWKEAVASFQRALQLRYDYAEAHCNMGVVLDELGRQDEAAKHLQHALMLRSDFPGAYANLGLVLKKLGRAQEAIAALRRALALDPDAADALITLIFQLNQLSDWAELPMLISRCLGMVQAGIKGTTPFGLLTLPSTPAQQLKCATLWASRYPTEAIFKHGPRELRASSKLRVGYLSGDFRRHAVAYLVAELFELHDRSRFEVIGFSYGPDDHSEMRKRLECAFDEFVDLRSCSYSEAAQRIHEARIDILVDLTGYTKDARTNILACRPAPIQINFIGYPGTMGAEFMDYIIADTFLIPVGQEQFYSEKVVYMPDCYQPNDRKRAVSENPVVRADYGLPENGFVFCCFNNNYKIRPEFFDIWMGLLRDVPDSILWLIDLEANTHVTANLWREAEVRGVSADRVVFAPRLPLAQHLARYRLADLFLDTLPYGAHTTASDALWVGLPVLTCVGDTFEARVGGSLLRAAGLPELITYSPTEYAVRALALATTQRDELARLRMRLEQNRLRCPLFDSERFTRHLERAFEHVWARHREGLLPESFSVTPLPAI